MDTILTKAVWKMRSQDDYRGGMDVNVILISTGGDTYQLYFPSRGCRYACTMCNYGFQHPIREQKILDDLDVICNNLPENTENVILESSGSFLDEAELPDELQEKIMQRIANTSLPRVEIETHYATVTAEKVKKLKKIFPCNMEVNFEFGLESTNPEVLKIYNKFMDLEQLLKTIWLSEKKGIQTSLNLMVGAPLLTIREQIQDATDAVNWVLSNCPKSTKVVLFPLNIKDYTLVKHMYNQNRYKIIYDWEFIEVLRNMPQEELNRIDISWWGNRYNIFQGEEAIIKPFHCNKCQKELNTFYRNFVKSTEAIQKKQLIEEISSYSCPCKEAYLKLKELQKKPELSYAERLEEEKRRLRKELHL